MTPTSIRGAVVSAKETVIVFGILLGYWAGDACSRTIVRGQTTKEDITGDWTRLYAATTLLALPMLGLTFLVPRSLRWLLIRGHRDEAIQSIKFVHRGDEKAIMDEFHALEASAVARNSAILKPASLSISALTLDVVSEHKRIWNRLFSPLLWPSLRAAMGLIVLQQFSGQPSVLSFSAVIFHAVGWNGHASVVTAFVMLCVSTATVFSVDRLGRKRLLYLCCLVLALAAATLAGQFWYWETGNESLNLTPTGKGIVLMAMFAFIGGYQIGFGPITWLVVSEVFPGDVRGAATALGVELNYLLNFLVQFLVPITKDRIGWGPMFGMYASIMVFAVSFVHLYVPETTGLSLEAIEEQMTVRRQKCEGNVIESLVNEHSPLVAESSELVHQGYCA
jgi:Sugar (and other) transporter